MRWQGHMNDELFYELMESVREGGAILRGEIAQSRRRDVLREQQKKGLVFTFSALSMLGLLVLVRLVLKKQ